MPFPRRNSDPISAHHASTNGDRPSSTPPRRDSARHRPSSAPPRRNLGGTARTQTRHNLRHDDRHVLAVAPQLRLGDWAPARPRHHASQPPAQVQLLAATLLCEREARALTADASAPHGRDDPHGRPPRLAATACTDARALLPSGALAASTRRGRTARPPAPQATGGAVISTCCEHQAPRIFACGRTARPDALVPARHDDATAPAHLTASTRPNRGDVRRPDDFIPQLDGRAARDGPAPPRRDGGDAALPRPPCTAWRPAPTLLRECKHRGFDRAPLLSVASHGATKWGPRPHEQGAPSRRRRLEPPWLLATTAVGLGVRVWKP
jgi:hypothetical protein